MAEEAKAKAEEALRIAKEWQNESRGAMGKGGVGAPRSAPSSAAAASRSFRGRGGGRGAGWNSAPGAGSFVRPLGAGPSGAPRATWRGARGGFRGSRGSGQGPCPSFPPPSQQSCSHPPPSTSTPHASQQAPCTPQAPAPSTSALQHALGPVSLNPSLFAALEGLARALVPAPVAASSPAAEPVAPTGQPSQEPVRYLANDFRERGGAPAGFNVVRERASPPRPMDASAPSNPAPTHPAPDRPASSRPRRR